MVLGYWESARLPEEYWWLVAVEDQRIFGIPEAYFGSSNSWCFSCRRALVLKYQCYILRADL